MAGTLSFFYRNTRFRTSNLSSNEDPEASLRFEALRIFLRCQPVIQAEQWSLSDFEFFFQAARHSFETPCPHGNLNMQQQRIKKRDGSRIRWSTQDIPQADYFFEVFSFLGRRGQIVENSLTTAEARQLLGQPCDVKRCTVQYLNTTWPDCQCQPPGFLHSHACNVAAYGLFQG